MTYRTLLMTTLAMFLAGPMSRAMDVLNPLGETDAELEQRMAWFNDARFGMFIHWGGLLGTRRGMAGRWLKGSFI